jgi:hypothetical protein
MTPRLDASTPRRVRVAVLSVVLLVVAGWGFRTIRIRDLRTQWKHPVLVGLVLVSERPLGDDVVSAWQDGSRELQSWLNAEALRHGVPLESPFLVQLFGKALVTQKMDWLAAPENLWDRLTHTVRLKEFLEGIDEAAGGRPEHDIRIYVFLEAQRTDGLGLVEGFAEAGGDFGFVRGSQAETDIGLELAAAAHEALHCLGAEDGYDVDGHARTIDHLAEPVREPLFPQDYAEVMVGEVATSARSGRAPVSLDELRVGPRTARAIRWTTEGG